MIADKQQRIKEIDKEIAKVGIIDAPGAIMLGLGLYAKFYEDGDAFLPILNDQSFVNMILVFGAAIMLWGAYKTFILARERAQLQKEPGI